MDDENINQEPEEGKGLGEKAKDGAKDLANKGVDKAKEKVGDAAKEALKKGAEKGAQTAAQSAATSGAAGAGAAGAGAAGAGAAGAAGAGAGAAAGGAAAGAGLAAAAYPILIATAVIICIITIIGILMFFITMPGMVIEKIKAIAKAIARGLASWFGTDNTEQIDDEAICETLTYLKEMGYDLKGYGFVSEAINDKNDLTSDEKKKFKLHNSDASDDVAVKYKDGVVYDSDDIIKAAHSEFIYTYMVSDNYVYTLANHNLVTQEDDDGFWGHLWHGIVALGQHAKDFFGGSYSEKYTNGMIRIYKEGDNGLGTIGDFYSDKGLFNFDDMDIDAEKKTFEIKKGIGNAYMTYNLDGWVGRYGMPLDFLLSVHVATMMPDLAMDMAGAFKTEIALVIHPVDGSNVESGFEDDSGNYKTYTDFKTAAGIGSWRISREEAQDIFEDPDFNIKSQTEGPYVCIGTEDPTYVQIPESLLGENLTESFNSSTFGNHFEADFINDMDKIQKDYNDNGCTTWTKLYNRMVSEAERNSDDSIKSYYASGFQKDNLKNLLNDLESKWDEAVSFTGDNQENPFRQSGEAGKKYETMKVFDTLGSDMALSNIQNTDGASRHDQIFVELGHFNKVESVNEDNVEDICEYTLELCLGRCSGGWFDGGTDNVRHIIVLYRDFTAEEIERDGISVDEASICSNVSKNKSCKNCRRYLQKIYDLLKKSNDQNFDYFIPYIAKVTDHWYRDVYFTMDSSSLSFVKSDYEYEALTQERWTDYERDATTGEYIYYKVNEDGTMSDEVYEPTVIDFIKLRYTKQQLLDMDDDELEELGITSDDIENIDFDNRTPFAKKALGFSSTDSDFTDQIEDLGWEKTSHNVWTAYHEDTTGRFTTEWVPLYPGTTDPVREHIATRMHNAKQINQVGEGLRTQTNPEIKKFFLVKKYFRYDGNEDTADVIEAFRKKYFKTDHVQDGEDQVIVYGNINDAKSKAGTALINMDSLDTYKIKKSDVNDKIYKDDDSLPDDERYFFLKDYIGNVSINSQSLSAFSMLENENTLDAEYIYRDFKELIVELGYFTKEEMTDEVPQMLAWVVPEVGSAGWPDRTIDKSQYVKGTMIHSKDDIRAISRLTMAAAIGLITSEGEENSDGIEGNGNDTTPGSAVGAVEAFDNTLEAAGIDRTKWTTIGSAGGGTQKLLTIENWWNECQKIFDTYKDDLWTYDDHLGYSDTTNRATHHADGTLITEANPLVKGEGSSKGCNCWQTFEAVRDAGTHLKTDCSLGASWLLHKLGALSEPKTFGSAFGDSGKLNNESMADDIISSGCEIVVPPAGTKFTDAANSGYLEPGDVLFYPGHVSTYCGESYKDCTKTSCWDTGSTSGIRAGGPRDCSWEDRDIKLIIRPYGKKKGEVYEGYEGNEEVVSPVTGILLAYGTYDPNSSDTINHEGGDKNYAARTNTDLRYPNINSEEAQGQDTGTPDTENTTEGGNTEGENTEGEEIPDVGDGGVIESDKVGYAIIKILTPEDYTKLEADLRSKTSLFTSANYVNENEVFSEYSGTMDEDTVKNWKDADNLLYGYKEFAENYAMTGLSGNIVVVDGFVCEEPDEAMALQDDNEIPNGEDITIDKYKKITKNSFDSTHNITSTVASELLANRYERPDDYKLASKKATDKINAESLVKTNALGSYAIGNTIYIKEGTVLGRTMTDKELATSIRGWDESKYSEYRPDVVTNDDMGKVIGNYLRLTMTVPGDTETVVENIEDYMKIDRETGRKSGIYGDLEAIDENSSDTDKVRAAMTYFVNQGFTAEAAAGILGNLIQESSLRPTALNSSGGYRGMAQWSTSWFPNVVSWMAGEGYDENSFAGQIRAIVECPDQGCMPGHWEEMKSLTQIDKAAECFAVFYEGCVGGSDPTQYYLIGTNYQELSLRKRYALNAYDIYMGDDEKGIKDNR